MRRSVIRVRLLGRGLFVKGASMEKRQDIAHKQNRLDKAIQRAVDAGFGVLALYLALKITDTYAAVDAFFNAHSAPTA